MDLYLIDSWKDVPTGVTVLLVSGGTFGQAVMRYKQNTGEYPQVALKERNTGRFYLPIEPNNWRPEGREPDDIVTLQEEK